MSPKLLPEAIFRFLNLSKIDISLKEEVAKLYITMFSHQSLSFIVSATHWPKLVE